MIQYGRRCLRLLLPGRSGARPVAGLLLAVYLLLVFGLPFPSAARTADRPDARYPCEVGRCGCRDAQTCWRNCCCHTPLQRLAWARRHGVTPPEYLHQLIAAGLSADAAGNPINSQPSTCCSRRSTDSPAATDEHVRGRASCCAAAAELPSSPSAVVVIGDAALKCRGLTVLFGVSTPILPLVWHAFDHSLSAREWVGRSPASGGPRRSDLPQVPPPESVNV
ncbi:MAG: hypothetical protein U0795_06715 [Pirellulales bacterium]